MKLLLVILISLTLMGQQPKKQSKSKSSKAKQVEVYDPDKLPPGEVACGRIGSTKAPPCQCVKHRMKKVDEEHEKCMQIVDRKARMECGLKIDPCPPVIDREQSWTHYDDKGEPMPEQCSRSCKLARCECCHS